VTDDRRSTAGVDGSRTVTRTTMNHRIVRLGIALATFGVCAATATALAFPAGLNRWPSRSTPQEPPVGLPVGLPVEPRPEAARAQGPLQIELESLAGNVRPRDPARGAMTSLRAEDAAFVRFLGAGPAPLVALSTADIATFTLADGDRFRGTVTTAGSDGLIADLGGVTLSFSVDDLTSIVFEERIPRETSAPPVPTPGVDALYILAGQNVDRAEGLLEEFTADGLAFEDSRAGRRSYTWSRIVALFVAPLDGPDESAPVDRATEPGDPVASDPAERAWQALDPVRVELAGGGRISGRLRSLDRQGVALERTRGVVLTLPAALVTEVALADGSFEYLSDLPLADAGPVSPFGDSLGYTWPHRVDRAVDGGPLQVAGKVYARGLGVHAPSRLTWSLEGRPADLRLGVGVDDSGRRAERGGSVRFRVLGDGRVLWESGVVRAGQPVLTPPGLELRAVRELVLEVDPQGDFVLDRANWLRPLLVRRR